MPPSLGVVVLALFLSYAGVLLYSSPLTAAERLLEVTSRRPLTVAAGAVVLAFPLAAVLGSLGAEG